MVNFGQKLKRAFSTVGSVAKKVGTVGLKVATQVIPLAQEGVGAITASGAVPPQAIPFFSAASVGLAALRSLTQRFG